ncbi:YbaN family protein [Paracoccus sp. S-4012]|uniref:YbaN family protein n=1 Tax=Paracoccus sp. S-4012 TaxID=2665648 RepID=UPI0018A1C5AE|nr:YbaN family protein [Paracoccus sp. S-4012]
MRLLWLIGGWLALGFGAIGLALPVVPTVPFLLLAVFCFARSSPALRERILCHPIHGPPVRAYLERGEIRRGVKLFSISAMTFGVVLALTIGVPRLIVGLQAAVCLAVAVYIASRPEPR